MLTLDTLKQGRSMKRKITMIASSSYQCPQEECHNFGYLDSKEQRHRYARQNLNESINLSSV